MVDKKIGTFQVSVYSWRGEKMQALQASSSIKSKRQLLTVGKKYFCFTQYFRTRETLVT
jgi:hypothetical protein